MAVVTSLYNHAAKLLANGEVDKANLKVVLLNGSGAFNAAYTQYSDVSANEVSGNGWDVGGELISNVAVTTVTTNDAKLDADDLSILAAGGSIGPAENAAILDATNNKLLVHIAFGSALTAGAGTPFLFTWNAAGIITFTV
ncbi:MAG: hypothetical protein EOS72_03055 [Mesorhizobium sp.]|uniref:hypothetical protein n=1 Tax=Mesorhizobium sp. TaxID=1871066 RepID=UPI000FE9CD54|nr:hypothetical protein [Mesorhizobium sp.]RWC91648.1 MAG: hypothetical protein EOS72_03055 [Mesorhizobium sp.]